MDPLTAALNFANALLVFAGKVWDATPEPLKQQSAGDWAKFLHNINDFVISLQGKINAAVK